MDIIKNAISRIESPDRRVMVKTQKRLDLLTKPQGSMGRLEELVKLIAGITGKESPSINNKFIVTMAADHGVTAEGISAYPKDVTAQMVYNFLNGGACINVLARYIGAKVIVVDMGVAADIKKHENLVSMKIGMGTKNMALGPAMSRNQAVKSIEAGIKIVNELSSAEDCDIIGTGDMGIGNTTASSAITAFICGVDVEPVTGRGTGIDDRTFKNKVKIIEKALSVNKPLKNDPVDILSKIGGFEIGGIAGLILGAASNRIPVVIDGFISGAAALIAAGLEPKSTEFMIASHCSLEKGHKIILNKLGLKPLLDLELRLGEGTGAELGISLIDAGIRIYNEMATFGEAGVSEKN